MRERTAEVPFVVSRVLLQDFTGVPLVVDLAAMRSAVARLGRNPNIVGPMVPVDLVIDHSVQVDFSTTSDAFMRNMAMEFKRNHVAIITGLLFFVSILLHELSQAPGVTVRKVTFRKR